MLKVKKYKLINKKINNKQKILLIADIHLCNNYNINILNDIINNVKIQKPNFICICGDIIDEFSVLEKKENEILLLNFLNELSKYAITLLTISSHDYCNLKKYKTGNISSESIKYWHNMIKKNKNNRVILLDNSIYENDLFNIIGYTPSRDYFKSHESEEVLIKEINCKFKNINKDKYTILMCHSPLKIKKKTLEQIKIINSVDLILSGHMHDGLLFPFLKKLPTTIGLVSPQKKFFPKNTRGRKEFIINNKKIVLIITGGIIKFSASSSKFLQKLNCLYYNDMDIIEIDNVKS